MNDINHDIGILCAGCVQREETEYVIKETTSKF